MTEYAITVLVGTIIAAMSASLGGFIGRATVVTRLNKIENQWTGVKTAFDSYAAGQKELHKERQRYFDLILERLTRIEEIVLGDKNDR